MHEHIIEYAVYTVLGLVILVNIYFQYRDAKKPGMRM